MLSATGSFCKHRTYLVGKIVAIASPPTCMVSYLLLSGLVVLYCAVVAIRRVYFSPLSKFPGPTIAALTTWYAAYHDIVRGGQMGVMPISMVCSDLVHHVSLASIVEHHGNYFPEYERRGAKLNHNGGL
ncbi:Cytochrome monooxygenase sdnE like protein [Verticillium longisporum]|nr:Cytochrome monooxygenase sdnE like protein [Verticillium longisporum]KAG7127789.1 Cytochrome monooxygenase sdnE like protein [Verticillium longisporum]